MLCLPSIGVHDLVAAADVVLVEEADRYRPELVRRALRTVGTGEAEVLALHDDLVAHARGAEPAKAA